MRHVLPSFRRAVFAAAVGGALVFGTGQALARTTVVECNDPYANGVCYSLKQCDYDCQSIGSSGGGCYQGCCYCAL